MTGVVYAAWPTWHHGITPLAVAIARWNPPAGDAVRAIAGPRRNFADQIEPEKTAANEDSAASSAEDDIDPIVARGRVEAVLLLSPGPVTPRKLAALAGIADATAARTAVTSLNALYDDRDRGMRIETVAGGYRMLTRPHLAPWLSRLSHLPPPLRLSPPMLETLAVVAYRGPVSRVDVESIRGVACGELLRALVGRDMVRIAGRSEELGRPYLYDTTKRFLQTFGLRNTDDLPAIGLDALNDEFSHANDSTVIVSPDSPSVTTPTEDSTQEPVVSTAVCPPAANPLDARPTDSAFTEPSAETAIPAAVIEDEEDDLYEDDGNWDDDENDDWDDPDDDDDIDLGDDDDEDDDDAEDDDEESDDDSDDESGEEGTDVEDDWEEVDDDESDDEFEGDADPIDDDEDWGEDDDDDDDDDEDDDEDV